MRNSPLRYNVYLYSILMLTFFFLSINNPIYAQKKETPNNLLQQTNKELIDTIKEVSSEDAIYYEDALIKRFANDSEKITIYSEIGQAFYHQGNTERCKYYYKKGISLAKQSNNTKALTNLYILLGNAELVAWHNEEALDAYYKALDIGKKEDGDKHRLIIVVHPNIAIILRRMGQLDQALAICNEALAVVNDTPDKNGRNHIRLLTIASNVHLKMKHFDVVLKMADQGISMSNQLDYKEGFVDLYTKKGIVYFHRQDYEESLRYLKIADKIYKENTFVNKTLALNINYFLASCYAAQEKYENAIRLLQEYTVSEDNDESKHYIILVYAYKLMATSYKNIGDHKRSSYWYDQHDQLNEKYQEDKDKIFNSIYERDTEYLGEQIESLEDQTAKGKRKAIYFLSLLIAVSLICILILYRYKKKQRSSKESFDKLLKKVNQLEMSSKELSKPKERTREIIIDDQKVKEVLKGLKRLEEQEFYLNTDCSLRSMAKKVKTNATYLSKIINTHKGLSYNDYINNLRIDYAVNRLKNDKKFRSFSIKSIATELGYKSDYSFAKHFKTKTGINPSYYIKRIEGV